jgi:hypothetical protein
MEKVVCYFGMTVRQRYDCALLESSIGHADRNMNSRRKFVRSIVTMAGLTTSIAKSVAKLFESGMQLLSNDRCNLETIYSRLLGSLLVLMMDSMDQDLEMSTMMMMVRLTMVNLRTSERYTLKRLQTR